MSQPDVTSPTVDDRDAKGLEVLNVARGHGQVVYGGRRGDQGIAFRSRVRDVQERRQRMEAFGRAFSGTDEGYRDEFRSWDVTLADGSPGE